MFIFSVFIPLSVCAATKERLVLMPLRLSDEDKSLKTAMEIALSEGLQQTYIVFSGDKVQLKAKEVFNNESKAAIKECDETKCMQDIAIAFQSELIAIANVTKRDNGYFLSLSIQNIFDNKIVYSRSIALEKTNSFTVIERLKELAYIKTPNISSSTNSLKYEYTEEALWEAIRLSNSEEDYNEYIEMYPNGKYIHNAHKSIANLHDRDVWVDSTTNLMWQDNPDSLKPYSSWQKALEYCKASRLAGNNDWYLPNKETLLDLYSKQASLRNKKAHRYWSSSRRMYDGKEFGYESVTVDFLLGTTEDTAWSTENFARCVRSISNQSVQNKNEIVTNEVLKTVQNKPSTEILIDDATHLMWQDSFETKSLTKNWNAAIDYCESLTHAGYEDWHLPDKDTLFRLFFNNASELKNLSYDLYWTSNQAADKDAWRVYFGGPKNRNSITDGSKNDLWNVRCVREIK